MLPLTHGHRRSITSYRENAPARRPEVRIHVRGPVPQPAVEYASRLLHTLLLDLPEPVQYARVKLTVLTDAGVTWPAIAQVNIDLCDRTVRAQAAAATSRESARLLATRLRARVTRLPRRLDVRPHHCLAQLNHLASVDMPASERAVLRRKACWLGRLTPEQAVVELEELDYDAHLFVERDTGQDAVVYRAGDGYRLALSEPPRRPPALTALPLTVSTRPTPTLAVTAAKAQIEALGLPFLFFLDDSTGRGAVLYHRYDGHFGLVSSTG